MPKLNCWQYKKCGREPGGTKVAELGPCPAAADNPRYSGINDGLQGGRICWALAGTLCGGKVQGTFAEKVGSCIACDFFLLVSREERGQLTIKPPE